MVVILRKIRLIRIVNRLFNVVGKIGFMKNFCQKNLGH